MAESVREHLEAAVQEYDNWVDNKRLCGDDLHPLGRHLYAARAALPGPRKLEWRFITDNKCHGTAWAADKWTIAMNCDGKFCGFDDDGENAKHCDSLAEAKAHCQSHADAADDPLAFIKGRI